MNYKIFFLLLCTSLLTAMNPELKPLLSAKPARSAYTEDPVVQACIRNGPEDREDIRQWLAEKSAFLTQVDATKIASGRSNWKNIQIKLDKLHWDTEKQILRAKGFVTFMALKSDSSTVGRQCLILYKAHFNRAGICLLSETELTILYDHKVIPATIE